MLKRAIVIGVVTVAFAFSLMYTPMQTHLAYADGGTKPKCKKDCD